MAHTGAAAPTDPFVPSPRPPAGPQRAVTSDPPRRPGSVRRTTTYDMARPDGPWQVIVADVRARDLRTDAAGVAHPLEAYAAEVRVAAVAGEVVAVAEDRDGGPADGRLDGLVGAGVRGGWRSRLAGVLADEQASRTLRFSALDDLGGALLVSGYAPLREGAIPRSKEGADRHAAAQADVCAGWAADGPLVAGLRTDGLTFTPMGPPAPDLAGGDPEAWHPLPVLAVGGVRRRRRLDVIPQEDGTVLLDSHLRDEYRAEDGGMVMHEYVVRATVDADGRLADVAVEDRVLPWQACPSALPSAQGVVGVAVADLPGRVRHELVGPGTCTHLTSTLRCLADAAALMAHL